GAGVATSVKVVYREHAVEKHERLAARQGAIRPEISVRPGDGQGARAVAGRSRGGPRGDTGGDGHAVGADDGGAGARCHRQTARDAGYLYGGREAHAGTGDGLRAGEES